MATNISTATMEQLVNDPKTSNPYFSAMLAGVLTPAASAIGNQAGKVDWTKFAQYMSSVPQVVANQAIKQTSNFIKPSSYIGQVGNVGVHYSDDALNGIQVGRQISNSTIEHPVVVVRKPVVVNGKVTYPTDELYKEVAGGATGSTFSETAAGAVNSIVTGIKNKDSND